MDIEKLEELLLEYKTVVHEMTMADARLDVLKKSFEIYEPIIIDDVNTDYCLYYHITPKAGARSLKDHTNTYYHIRLLKKDIINAVITKDASPEKPRTKFTNILDTGLLGQKIPLDVLRYYLNRKFELEAEFKRLGILSAEVAQMAHYRFPINQQITYIDGE